MKKYGKRLAPVISMDGARVRQHIRRTESEFKPKDNLTWVCRCGCWQYELTPEGVLCVGCGTKQYVTITTKLNE